MAINDPKLHLRFDEEGTIAVDRSGNAHHGTITGTPDLVTGQIVSALDFDGTGDYVTVPDHADLNPTNITVACWIKTTASGVSSIIHKNDDQSPFEGYGLILNVITSGKVSAWVGGSAWTTATTTVNDGNWHHVLFTYDGTNVRVYVDGVLEATQAQTASLTDEHGLRVGANAETAQNFFAGRIDDVRVYSRALSGAEITALVAWDGNGRSPTTYYVSATGSDAANGTTTGTPWQTISKVMSNGLIPGDTVRFNGGDTFSGNLLVEPLNTPTTSTPITISSYGTGQAIINPSNSYGIKVLNTGWVTITGNILVDGPGITLAGTYPTKTGSTTSTTAGIVWETNVDGVIWRGNKIITAEVQDCLHGILVTSTFANGTQGFRDGLIDGCEIHDCGVCGIWFHGTGSGSYPHERTGILHRDCDITNCNIYNIWGITGYDYGGPAALWSGFAVFLVNCQDCLIEDTYGANCGEASFVGGGGPVTFIFASCTGCICRRCEANGQWSPAGIDGEGFDCDLGSVSCIIEYCYARNCDGAGILFFTTGAGSGNIARYNILENNGRNGDSCTGIRIDSMPGSIIHNNTIYSERYTDGPNTLIDGGPSAVWLNNIFAINGSMNFGAIHSSSTLVGNCYRVGSGASFNLSGFTSLAALRTAGYEAHSAVNYGASGDPEFSNPGGDVQTLPNHPIVSLSSYDLGATSAAKDCGVDIALFSLAFGNDFHGNAEDADFDAGAVYFGSHAPGGLTFTNNAMFRMRGFARC